MWSVAAEHAVTLLRSGDGSFQLFPGLRQNVLSLRSSIASASVEECAQLEDDMIEWVTSRYLRLHVAPALHGAAAAAAPDLLSPLSVVVMEFRFLQSLSRLLLLLLPRWFVDSFSRLRSAALSGFASIVAEVFPLDSLACALPPLGRCGCDDRSDSAAVEVLAKILLAQRNPPSWKQYAADMVRFIVEPLVRTLSGAAQRRMENGGCPLSAFQLVRRVSLRAAREARSIAQAAVHTWGRREVGGAWLEAHAAILGCAGPAAAAAAAASDAGPGGECDPDVPQWVLRVGARAREAVSVALLEASEALRTVLRGRGPLCIETMVMRGCLCELRVVSDAVAHCGSQEMTGALATSLCAATSAALGAVWAARDAATLAPPAVRELVTKLASRVSELQLLCAHGLGPSHTAAAAAGVRAVQGALADFVNAPRPPIRTSAGPVTSVVQLLLLAVDYTLTRPSGGGAAETDAPLRIGPLVALVREKDALRDEYARALARRLLAGAVSSHSRQRSCAAFKGERGMLEQLSRVVGRPFVVSLEGMIAGAEAAVGGAAVFAARNDARALMSLAGVHQFGALVLRQSEWPLGGGTDLVRLSLAPRLAQLIELFAATYKSANPRRVLVWRHDYSVCTIMLHSTDGALREALGSLAQASALLHLDAVGSDTLAGLAAALGVTVGTAQRLLHSLSSPHAGGCRVVRPCGDGTGLAVNSDLHSAPRKMKLPAVRSDTTRERAEDAARRSSVVALESSRAAAIDAAIVRVMKGRRRVRADELRALVSDAVCDVFPLAPKLFKTRVEELVQREYLRRAAPASDIFEYAA